MKQVFIIILIASGFSVIAQSKNQRKLAGYTSRDYEVACIGVGVEGTKIIEILGYGQTPEEAERQAKRNAIHAIIFKGAPGVSGGCQGIKALAKSMTLEQERADFFKPFFNPGGQYLNFVSLSTQGGNSRTVVRVEKKIYKVGINALVSYNELRKELENAGVIRKLGAGF